MCPNYHEQLTTKLKSGQIAVGSEFPPNRSQLCEIIVIMCHNSQEIPDFAQNNKLDSIVILVR